MRFTRNIKIQSFYRFCAVVATLAAAAIASADDSTCSTRNNFKDKIGAKDFEKYANNQFTGDTQNDLEFCVYYAMANTIAAKYGVQVSRLSIARIALENLAAKQSDSKLRKKSWEDIGEQGNDANKAFGAIQGKPLCLEKAFPSSPTRLLTGKFTPQAGRSLGDYGSKGEMKSAFALIENMQDKVQALAKKGTKTRADAEAKKKLLAELQDRVNLNADLVKKVFPGIDLAHTAETVWKNREMSSTDLIDSLTERPSDGLTDSYKQLLELQRKLSANATLKDDALKTGGAIHKEICALDSPAQRLFTNLYPDDIAEILWADRSQRFFKLLGDLEEKNCRGHYANLPKIEWEQFNDDMVNNANKIIDSGDIAVAESGQAYGHDMTLIGREQVNGQCYFTLLNNWGEGPCKNQGIVHAVGVDDVICRHDGTLLVSDQAFPNFIDNIVHIK